MLEVNGEHLSLEGVECFQSVANEEEHVQFDCRWFDEDGKSTSIVCFEYRPRLANKQPVEDVLKMLDGAVAVINRIRADVLRDRT